MRNFVVIPLLLACSRSSAPPDATPVASEAPCPLEVDLGPLYTMSNSGPPEWRTIWLLLTDGGTLYTTENVGIYTPILPGGASEWYRADSQIRLTTGQIVSDVLDAGVGHLEGYSSIGYATAQVRAASVNYDAPLTTDQRYDIDIVVRHYVHTQCRWEIGVRDVGLVNRLGSEWIWAMQSPSWMAEHPGYPYTGIMSPRPDDDDGGPGHDTAAADTRR